MKFDLIKYFFCFLVILNFVFIIKHFKKFKNFNKCTFIDAEFKKDILISSILFFILVILLIFGFW